MPITIPIVAADGAKSTVTVADPVVNTATRGLITAFNPATDNWSSPDNLIIDGVHFFVETANKSWSLTKIDNYTVRMELRPGELWADDGTSRAEILTIPTIPIGGIFYLSYGFTVDAGTPNANLAWQAVLQAWADGGDPFSFGFRGDKLSILVNQALPIGEEVFLDTQPMVRGRTYNMRIEAKFSGGSDGYLKIWRDGTQIVNYSGQLGNGLSEAYIKFGVYQGWPNNVTQTIAARFDHIAIDIPAPPPPPPLPPGPNNVGITQLAPSTDSGNAGLICAQKVTLSTAASLQKIAFYTNNAVGNIKMALYDATGTNGDPKTKIAETASSAAAAGWNIKNTTTNPMLQPGDYWMAYEVSSNSLTFRNGAPGKLLVAPQAYGTMPATFPTPTLRFNDAWSFYMTVNV